MKRRFFPGSRSEQKANSKEAGPGWHYGCPGTSFTVNSETQITATTPATTTPGAVDTSVTTPAGTTATSSADRFTYTGPPVPQPLPAKVSCTVPKLKGKKLKAAKQALLKAECKLGKVKGKKSSAKPSKPRDRSYRGLEG